MSRLVVKIWLATLFLGWLCQTGYGQSPVAIQMVSPEQEAVFFLEKEPRPEFHWKLDPELLPKPVIEFVLGLGDEVVFRSRAVGLEVRHSDQLEEIYRKYAKSGITTFFWQVIGETARGEPLESAKRSFRLLNAPGVFHDVLAIQCAEPAYNADGSKNYTAKLKIFNNLTGSTLKIGSPGTHFSFLSPGGGIAYGFQYCSFPWAMPLPIFVSPGSSVVLCFSFTVPAGTDAIVTQLSGEIDGLTQISRDADVLPRCTCDHCDTWTFVPSLGSALLISSQLSQGRLFQSWQLNGAAPIQQVQAEIVSFSHAVNDEQCLQCVKKSSQMGLWGIQPVPGRMLGGTWKNGGKADLSDHNGDGWGNRFTWTARYFTGVDFSTPRSMFMFFGAPPLSSLDCCESDLNICVRYTFTDINCRSCDTLVCYPLQPYSSGGWPLPDSILNDQTGQQIPFPSLNN